MNVLKVLIKFINEVKCAGSHAFKSVGRQRKRVSFFVFDLVPVHFFIINDVTFGFIQYIFMM